VAFTAAELIDGTVCLCVTCPPEGECTSNVMCCSGPAAAAATAVGLTPPRSLTLGAPPTGAGACQFGIDARGWMSARIASDALLYTVCTTNGIAGTIEVSFVHLRHGSKPGRCVHVPKRHR